MARSNLVPYVPGEHPGDRHARRLQANLMAQGEVRTWAAGNGVKVEITNRGHHWRFTRDTKVAEWWPSSAKLVIQRKYQDDNHVHDHRQALVLLKRHFGEVFNG